MISILKRLGSSLVAMIGIVCITFILMKSIPGDPFTDEKALPREIHENLRRHYGLDDPWHKQLKKYFSSILHFDFGPSFKYPEFSVNAMIREGFSVSILLGLEAFFLALNLGLLFGTVSALYRNHWQDTAIICMTTLGISVPSFILATLLQYGFALKLGLFPLARWGTFSHSILPAIALAAQPTAFLSRLVRSNMIEVLSQDCIHTAKAKGLSKIKIILKHALPLAVLPIFPYIAQLMANVLMGSFIIEQIFAIPGLGSWVVKSVSNRDYTVIMGVTVFYSFLLLGVGALMDFLYIALDKRQRAKA